MAAVLPLAILALAWVPSLVWSQDSQPPGEVKAAPRASSEEANAKREALPRASKKLRPTKQKAAIRFSGSAGLQVIYDDNILRSSDVTILEFRQGLYPDRYRIHSYDDLIVSPRLNVTLGRKFLGNRETTLRLGYIRWEYLRNRIKNNESYTLRLRQPTIGRDYLEFGFTHAPIAYIRELSDRAPFVPVSTPLRWEAFRSRRNAFLLAYNRRILDPVSIRFEGGRVLRFYNHPFMENDNWEWNGSTALTASLSKAVQLTGTYTYSDVRARGLDTLGETRATSDDGDPSYERDLYDLEIGLSPRGRLGIVNALSLTGQYMAYYFTSKRRFWDDPFHVGRKDQVYMFEMTAATAPVVGPMTLEAGYRFSQRTSSSSAQGDIGEEKDYKDNRIWVGAGYPF